jgi:hypothetical protein
MTRAMEEHAIIKLNDDWGFWVDEMNYTLCRRGVVGESKTNRGKSRGKSARPENIGKEVWRPQGYYSTLDDVIKGYFTQLTRQCLAETKDDEYLNTALDRVMEEYRSAVKAVKEKYADVKWNS